jgi:ABC-type transporter Mla maintaining outer membrane lipid asymmetry ATPase subunit MlaF
LTALLSFRDIWVEFGDRIILEKINLDIAEKSIVSIVGPSGAGKSSLLRLVLGQQAPRAGASCSMVPLWPANAGLTGAWCSSAIRCFRT